MSALHTSEQCGKQLTILHLVVLAISLKLILRPVGKSRPAARCSSAWRPALILVLARVALPRSCPCAIALLTLTPVRFHDLLVTLPLSRRTGEGIGYVHGKHGPVERLQLAGLLLRDPVLRGGKVKVAFCVVNPLSLSAEPINAISQARVSLEMPLIPSQCVSTSLFGLLRQAKRVSCAGNILLFHELQVGSQYVS